MMGPNRQREAIMRMRTGFTLIELLVVITIIVVLLALLTPALDSAIYQAVLLTCGTNQRAVATGLTTYAFDNRRTYPDRAMPDLSVVIPAHKLTHPYDAGAFDLRPMIRPYFPINKLLNDPFVDRQVDMDKDDLAGGSARTTHIYAPLFLWGGWAYTGRPGMKKIGDRFAAVSRPSGRVNRYSLLVGDIDTQEATLYCTHPDDRYGNPNLVPLATQDEPWAFGGLVTTTIWWRSSDQPPIRRSPVDLNFAYDDGSVKRVDQVLYRPWVPDDRMAFIPNNHNNEGGQTHVPRQ
jgi:prepilin-type N-terminal cleavage/methylation domain-containing protein